MNERDLPSSNSIPDMTLYTPIDSSVPMPADPTTSGIQLPNLGSATWRPGDKAFAPWDPGSLYYGVISAIRSDQAEIDFADGDRGTVILSELRPVTLLKSGMKVRSRRGGGRIYLSAEVVDVRTDEARMKFDADESLDWVPLANICISNPAAARTHGAIPTRIASHLAVNGDLRSGSRVWAPWGASVCFVGTVAEVTDSEALIHFDDGDRGWVQLVQVFEFVPEIGVRVMARWRMRREFYPGTIDDIDENRVFIRYDDGDREWTTAAGLAVVCEPLGPDARPVGFRSRFGPYFGYFWIVAIVAAAMLFRFFRR